MEEIGNAKGTLAAGILELRLRSRRENIVANHYRLVGRYIRSARHEFQGFFRRASLRFWHAVTWLKAPNGIRIQSRLVLNLARFFSGEKY
jgi:hypothetical protein